MTTVVCSICLENTKFKYVNKRFVAPQNNECKILKCKHVFHSRCIKKWYAYGNQCPCCREPMKFHKHGSYYQTLLDDSQIRSLCTLIKVDVEKTDYNELCKYIYYDNAMILLYTECFKILLFHFCTWYIKQNTLDAPI